MITNGIDVNRSRKVYLWIYLCSKYTYMGRCAELVSQRAVNPSPSGIVGSSPTRPTIWDFSSVGQSIRLITEVSSVRITEVPPFIYFRSSAGLEYYSDKVGVGGSSPPGSTIL